MQEGVFKERDDCARVVAELFQPFSILQLCRRREINKKKALAPKLSYATGVLARVFMHRTCCPKAKSWELAPAWYYDGLAEHEWEKHGTCAMWPAKDDSSMNNDIGEEENHKIIDEKFYEDVSVEEFSTRTNFRGTRERKCLWIHLNTHSRS